MKERGRQFFAVGVIVLIIGILSFMYWGSKKQVWFCDEIFTYESSNGFEQPWPAEITDVWQTGKQVEGYFAADWDRLSLKDISDRLYCDHVPLYFWTFRVVSLWFFHGSGSMWIGLSMNLFFYLVAMALMYVVFCKLTEKPVIAGMGILLTFVSCRLMLEQATTLRMYMMLLTAELLFLAAELLVLRATDKKGFPLGEMILMFAAGLFGFLTHYDFWIFYAVAATLFCGWLLIAGWKQAKKGIFRTREFRLVLLNVGNFVLSLGATVLLFPYCRWNLNRGKGETALHSVGVFSMAKLRHILWGYGRLSKAVFGEHFPVFIGLLLLLGVLVGGCIVLWKRKEKKTLAGFLLTILVTQGYQLAVCFTLPDGEEERYLWGTFTIVLFCAFYGVVLISRYLYEQKEQLRKPLALILGFLFGLFLTLGFLAMDGGKGIQYLLCEGKDVQQLEEVKNLPWLVYNPVLSVYSYDDWKLPEKICFLSGNDTEVLKDTLDEVKGQKEFVLYANEDVKQTAVSFLEQQTGETYMCEVLTQSTVMTVYKLSAN